MTGENSMYMPVAPAYNGGDGMFGGNFAWWIIILLIFGGWGNGLGGNNGFVNGDIQRGFDQATLTNGISNILQGQCNGFAQAEINANSRQMADMQQNFAMQTALQNCCCENRAGNLATQNLVASEAAATRAASANDRQMIMDKLCQLEMDGMRQNYEGQLRALQDKLDAERNNNQALRFAASQGAQTAAIIANNEAQTTAIEQYLAPVPRPAYVVQNPNCCAQAFGSGCSCAAG